MSEKLVSVRKGDLGVLVAAVTSHLPADTPQEVAEAFGRLLTAFDEAPAAEDAPGSEPQEPVRFALVEQMGHRSTVATVRETVFCGQPMLEVTDLKTGSVHLVSPQSIYEISWLTEDEARARVTVGARARAWTATAITAGQQLAYDEDAEADDLDDVDPFTLGGDPIEDDDTEARRGQ